MIGYERPYFVFPNVSGFDAAVLALGASDQCLKSRRTGFLATDARMPRQVTSQSSLENWNFVAEKKPFSGENGVVDIKL